MASETAYFPDALSRTVEVRDGPTSPSESLLEPSRGALDEPAADRLSGISNEQLMEQIRNGAKEALGALFRRHARAVCNVAYRILRDGAEAEDLCQEVFLSLFQKAKFFDASKGSASTWIVQIAYRRAMNRRQYLARRQHYNTQELDEERIGGARQPVLVDEITARNLLNRLREQLSEEQRATLELHFFEGYSLREIADRTNQTLGNVRHHFYRGLRRLRSNLFPQKDA
jgi:RNA polymerase sigma-70 factor, ECF subfamily